MVTITKRQDGTLAVDLGPRGPFITITGPDLIALVQAALDQGLVTVRAR